MHLIFHFFCLDTKETKHLPAERLAISASRQEEKIKEKQCFNTQGLRTPAVFPTQRALCLATLVIVLYPSNISLEQKI